MDGILWVLQVLVSLLRAWDRIVEVLMGTGNQGWMFGAVTPPTEFDTISHAAALLWLYRNVASGVVLCGFLLSIGVCVVLVGVLFALVGWCGISWWWATNGEDCQNPDAGTGSPPYPEALGPLAVSFPGRRLMLPPSGANPSGPEQERLEFVRALRQALQAARIPRDWIHEAAPEIGSIEVSTMC